MDNHLELMMARRRVYPRASSRVDELERSMDEMTATGMAYQRVQKKGDLMASLTEGGKVVRSVTVPGSGKVSRTPMELKLVPKKGMAKATLLVHLTESVDP